MRPDIIVECEPTKGDVCKPTVRYVQAVTPSDRSPYKSKFRSEFAGILQIEIRQRVSGVRMLIPIWREGSMRSSYRVTPVHIGILRHTACSPPTQASNSRVIGRVRAWHAGASSRRVGHR